MPTMKEQFDAFHAKHPEIYPTFIMFTRDLWHVGLDKIRADEVLHRVRWALIIAGKYDLAVNELKVLFGNRYAMKLMTEDDNYKGFFDLTVVYGS